MLLNRAEKVLMNNPIRSAIQRHFEAKRLLAMGGPMNGGRALEVGCGRGIGTEIILDLFGADHVDAFDLDPDMVRLARKRLSRFGDKVKLWTGDLMSIPSAENIYDAVFDFAIIHHIPDWRKALEKVHRLLKPGGRFYAEEVFEKFTTHPFWRRILDHPEQGRFNHDQFRDALEQCGFRVKESNELWQQFGWFVADKVS